MHNYDLSGTRVGGPLAGLAAGFSAYLTGQGYAGPTVRQHLGLMADLSAWLGERGLGAGQLSPAVADGFAAVMRDRRTHLVSALALAPLLGYLAERGVLPAFPRDRRPPDAQTALLQEYREYLRSERSAGEATIRSYLLYAAGFVTGLGDPLEAGLASLAGAQVLQIVSAQLRRHPPRSAAAAMNADRALLRFLYLTGRIPRPLAQVIPAAARRPPRLPEPLDPAAVTALLDSCDRSTEAGRRDYAVLVLLRRYGPRGIEVSRLELADLRWRAGEIVIHGKGGRTDVLPLMHDAGHAVARYLLLRRRPESGRYSSPGTRRRGRCTANRCLASSGGPARGPGPPRPGRGPSGTRWAVTCLPPARHLRRSGTSCATTTSPLPRCMPGPIWPP